MGGVLSAAAVAVLSAAAAVGLAGGPRHSAATRLSARAAPPRWSGAADRVRHVRNRGSRLAEARRAAVADLAQALAGELRAGADLAAALGAAAESGRVLGGLAREAAAAATLGADPAAVLASAATLPGAAGLGAIAAALRVGQRAGAVLAPALIAVAEAAEADERVRHEVLAQLAGPRATAWALAALPAAGLVLAAGMGAHPQRLLLGTLPGGLLLGTAVALTAAGWRWLRALARRAAPP